MNTLFIALLASVIGPGVLALLLGWQRKNEKHQDYERQDAVAAEAKRSADEVADQAAKAAKLLLDRQDEVAKQAEGVAQLLLAAQQKTTKETAEVARLAAGPGGGTRGRAMVTITYPNGRRRDVFLDGIPRVGERIRTKDGMDGAALVVEHVLYLEAGENGGSTSIIGVRAPH